MRTYIRNIVQTEGKLVPGRLVVLGFSGGPDSLVLLDALVQAGYPVIAAHFNHQLRPTAQQEAFRAAELARQCGAEFVLEEGAVGEVRRQRKESLEAVAREMRYRFLFGLAERSQAQAVVTAHTADDQAETVLMHLLRGAGIDGLRGMAARSTLHEYSREIPLVRPLLKVWRQEVLVCCEELGLEPVSDPSNQDLRFFRNQVRLKVLPFLEAISPKVRQNLHRLAFLAQEEAHTLEVIAQKEEAACVEERGEGYVCVNRKNFTGNPPGLQRRLLRRMVGHLHGQLTDVAYQDVQRVLDFVNAGRTTGKVDLALGTLVVLEAEQFWLLARQKPLPVHDFPQLSGESPIAVEVPGKIVLGDGWEMVVERVQADLEQIKQNRDSMQAWLNIEPQHDSLILRARRDGDRFTPLGLANRTQKLSDYMINNKLPERARDRWPLLCVGEAIAWVPGGQVGHAFRVQEDTPRAVHCIVRRILPR